MDIKSTSVLGYVYPETQNGASVSSVRAAVNSLYGPGSSNNKRDIHITLPYEGRPPRVGDNEYLLNINSLKNSLGGPFTIYAFLGNVSSDYTTWATAPNLIGSNGVLGAYSQMNTSDVQIEGCIPLTTVLQGKVASGEISGLDVYSVSSYLKQHLSWRVVKVRIISSMVK